MKRSYAAAIVPGLVFMLSILLPSAAVAADVTHKWYKQPEWYGPIIAFLALLGATAGTLITRKLTRPHFTYQCDSQFLEIQKLFISDPRLYDFYRLGPEMTTYWSGLSKDEKRLYLFTEIHYFHLAFAYREYKAGRVKKDYWKLYEHWLETLIQHSPMFRQVHKLERWNFENAFDRLVVDKINGTHHRCWCLEKSKTIFRKMGL